MNRARDLGRGPVQYSESRAVFLGMDVKVDPRVLIPRPETELLVTVAADLCRKERFTGAKILEVGTGSGAISLGLTRLMDDCFLTVTDVSTDALCVAKENFDHYGISDRIELKESDMFKAFDSSYDESFDAVVSNPPYVSRKDYDKLDVWVKSEPKDALIAGEDGFGCLRTLAEESGRLIKDGGFIALEIGYDQAEKVKNVLAKNGFTFLSSFKDFNGIERVVVGWKHG